VNIVLIRPPGSGKGTQAQFIVQKYNIPQISTGDMLRVAVKANSPIGIIAKSVMEVGGLVSDDIVFQLVRERVSQSDCSNGFILDGFPRTISQADTLIQLLQSLSKKIDYVISLEVDSKELLLRLSGRRTCPSCGKGFHILYNKPEREGVCNSCGTYLVQRDDDSELTVMNRLNVYEQQTSALKEYFSQLGILYNVSGSGSIEKIQRQVSDILDSGGIGDHSKIS